MTIFTKMKLLILFLNVLNVYGYGHHRHTDNRFENNKLETVFSWRGIGYEIDREQYYNTTDEKSNPNVMKIETSDADRFFIPYNNLPIGFEVFMGRVFVTVPRRRYGIPSTLNYIDAESTLLKPYPDASSCQNLVSTYRPRVDACGRLWVVDTGLVEIQGARRQVQPPAILVYDLKNDKQVLRYELKPNDLVNERTPGGLTSITIDVCPGKCDEAYAYINDLATYGLIVFSMKHRDSWRLQHESFKYDVQALNFSVSGITIPWQDGIFSVALSDLDGFGNRRAYFHPLVSNDEFVVDTAVLKSGRNLTKHDVQNLGSKGPTTQSGSHAYHPATNTLFYATVAQDAILCWNVNKEMTPENVAVVLRDREKLLYISDLKIVYDHVWVLVNQLPRSVYSTLDPNQVNYYIHRAKIQELIRGTVCES